MKRLILTYFLTAFALSVGASQTHAQIVRRCPSGACPYSASYRVANYQRVYAPYSYQYAQTRSVAPCEAATETAETSVVEPCAPVQTTIDEPTVAPCDPVCESCERGEYLPTDDGNVCVDGTCPIRTAVRATANTAKNAVQTVAATTRFLLAANRIRAQYGLAALQADEALDTGCESQATYCSRVGQLVHGGGNDEILAYNYSGFDAALVQWLNSPAHRSLLLSGNYRAAGVAVVRGNDGRVWCAMRFR